MMLQNCNNHPNLLVLISIGFVSFAVINDSCFTFVAVRGRCQQMWVLVVADYGDAYNASPQSMLKNAQVLNPVTISSVP